MRKYGEYQEVTQNEMDVIATYMNDEIREQVHGELAPCTPEEFLDRYCELDPDFEDLLKDEFSIELKNGEPFKVSEDDELTPEEKAATKRYC